VFGKKPKVLDFPPAVSGAQEAFEIARIWIVDGDQHVTLLPETWPDPAAWGILLVDLAKHLAIAYHQTAGRDHADTLRRIREGFEAEWENATDNPSGGLSGH
jgi:hypothetical protein